MTAPTQHMRAGDELPSLAIQILNTIGDVVQIPRGTVARILLRQTFSPERSLVLIGDVNNDVITYDWQQEDADALEIGAYDLSVHAEFPDGSHIIAPTDHHAELIVGPNVLLTL